jgi:alpha-2-macroglobulin
MEKQFLSISLVLLLTVLHLNSCKPSGDSVTPRPAKPFKNDESHGGIKSMRETVDPFTGLALMKETAADRKSTIYMGPQPPKRPTEKLSAWPIPHTKPKVAPQSFGPLKVLRKHPVGVVGNISVISITFNQPMIPLTSLIDQRSIKVPIIITPLPKGQWRWLGTSTLSYETGVRLPQSTRFVVTVPAGTKSALGNSLKKKVSFTFETKRVQLSRTIPGRYNKHVIPEDHIKLYFNQKVLPRVVAEHAYLKSTKGRILKFIPAPTKQWLKTHKNINYETTPMEFVIMKPSKLLKKATHYTVIVPSGMKSTEGPLKSQKRHTSYFQTYSPLSISWVGCSYYNKHDCYPNQSPYISFNNSLKPGEKLKGIKVRPRVKGLKIRTSGSSLILDGEFLPSTKYKVTVRSGIEDIYQQKLQRTWSGSFFVKNAHPSLQFPHKKIGVLERKNSPRFYMRGYNNMNKAKVVMVKINPENLPFALFLANKYRHYYSDKRDHWFSDYLPGKKKKIDFKINRRKNRLETAFLNPDISLKGKGGALFIELKSPDLIKNKYSQPFRHALVQVTDIGLSARYDKSKIILQANSLASGKPYKNTKIQLYASRNEYYYKYKKKTNLQKTGKLVWSGKTRKDGTLIIPSTHKLKSRQTPLYIVARTGKDWSFLVLGGYGDDRSYASNFGYIRKPGQRHLRKYIFTERNPYRPGETVHITGILRSEDLSLKGTIENLPKGEKLSIKWRINNPKGKKMKEGVAKIDEEGVFHVEYKGNPEDSVGYYSFSGKVKGLHNHYSNSIYHSFRILAYRKPEHAVSVRWLGDSYILGETLKATVKGTYLFGGPMAQAETKWNLRSSASGFSPPGHPDYRFGSYQWGSTKYKNGKAKLNDKGYLDLSFKNEIPKNKKSITSPMSYHLEAQVFDPARQSVASRATIFVHPASFYVGLKMKKNVIQVNESNRFFIVTPNIKGTLLTGKNVKITATTNVYTSKAVKKGKYWTTKWSSKKVTTGSCSVVSGISPQSCKISFKKGGSYAITAQSVDEKGRIVITKSSFYVYSRYLAPWERWKQKNRNKIDVVADKSIYEPGEVAKLLIKAPFENSVGILTVERAGIITHKFLKIKGARTMINIPLEEYQIPGIYVSVSLSKHRTKVKNPPKGVDDPGRPMFATVKIPIKISTNRRKIGVTVTPSKKVLKPGETITVKVKTADWKGNGIASRVALFVVDEGALSLLGYKTPNPIDAFYYNRGSGTALEDIRADLLKKLKRKYVHKRNYNRRNRKPMRAMGMMNGGGGLGGHGSSGADFAEMKKSAPAPRATTSAAAPGGSKGGGLSFKVRKFFATTAYFNNKLKTNSHGLVTTTIKMPENLTAFRIMAVVVDKDKGKSFGNGQARVNIRKQFMIRPSLPRFANFGDTFEASVIVNNLTKEDGKVTVKLEGVGFKLLEKNIKTIDVPSGRDKELAFKIKTLRPGRIRMRFSGFMGKRTDSVEPPPMKVNIPATTEATATYGVTTTSTLQPIKPPSNANGRFGGLDIHMSSTALTGLQDAIKYLVDYPYYSSTEGLASTIAPIFALGEILSSFKIGSVVDRDKQNSRAKRGIKKLVNWQKYNGGWSYWPSHWRPCAYCTTYVTWVLLRGREAGFKIPLNTLNKSGNYLQRIVDSTLKWNNGGGYMFGYTMRVMAGWVLSELQTIKGVTSAQSKTWLRRYMKEIYTNGLKYLPHFAKAWLMVTMHRVGGFDSEIKQLFTTFQNSVVQSASSVHFAESTARDLQLLMHSTSRTDAIVLRAFMETHPKDVIIPKVVKGLMKGRINGRWETTQANVFALDSLRAYYKKYEKAVPNYKAEVWYGNGYMGKKLFKGRSMAITHKKIPMSYLIKKGAKDLILGKSGQGKLYYRLGLVYVPNNLRLKPESQGFLVLRSYEAMEGKDSVKKLPDGSWQIKAGKMVKVKLTIVAPGQKYYVAVNDPFPAGLEPVDMSLRTSASSTYGSGGYGYRRYGRRRRYGYGRRSYYGRSRYGYWGYSSPNHQEMRDDRYLIFWNRMPAGTYSYSYYTRSTTIGRFITPPCKAHELYEPENFGRTGTDIVNIVK